MSVCVCVRGACVCVCEWRGEFNRVVLVVQLGLIFHFILNPEQRRVFQLVQYKNNCKAVGQMPDFQNLFPGVIKLLS
jgi:hypothetical protein